MDYEATLRSIGNFGYYQKLVICLIGLLFMGSGMQTLLNVLILYVPDFRCDSNHTYGNITYNSTKDECYLYPNNETGFNLTDRPEERIECKSWVYDKSDLRATAATDMNFVCGKADMIPLTNMVLMGGILAISFVLGFFSDWKGRKPAEITVLIIQVLCTFPLYFIESGVVLVVLRFFGGVCVLGAFVAVYIISMEIVPSDYVPYVSLFSQVMFSVGELVVTGIAYITREWHLLCLVLSVIYFIFLFFMFFIDESPRWLISKGKLNKAETILRKIAKKNGKDFYEKLSEDTCNEETAVETGSFKDIFKSKILLYRAFNMFFNCLQNHGMEKI